ncbi:MAG TPA: hypothetical protein VF483_00495 [Gemmatimonadaceae bacterium]
MSVLSGFNAWRRGVKAAAWRRAGRVPGAGGHGAARWIAIERAVSGATVGRYGWDDAGIDERVVEYAWAFDRVRALARPDQRALDAGSVLNYPAVLGAWRRAQLPPVSIVTLKYEGFADPSDDVRYEFADLRQLPYRDAWFRTVLSLSTLEHVGLDNRIYGASGAVASDPGVEVGRALSELHRVTETGGTLLVSVPFGVRSNRGWFRIFDAEDLKRITEAPGWNDTRVRHFRQTQDGWRECSSDDSKGAGYNEPRNRPGNGPRPRG